MMALVRITLGVTKNKGMFVSSAKEASRSKVVRKEQHKRHNPAK